MALDLAEQPATLPGPQSRTRGTVGGDWLTVVVFWFSVPFRSFLSTGHVFSLNLGLGVALIIIVKYISF